MTKRERILREKRIKRFIILWSLLGLLGLFRVLYTLIALIGGVLGIGIGTGGTQGLTEGVAGGGAWGLAEGTDVDSVQGFTEGLTVNGTWGPADSDAATGTLTSADLAERCQSLYEASPELLVLVNKEHELEAGVYEASLRSICNGRLQASEYLYEDLVAMLAAAKEEGYQYWIASAYRSRERQQELVDEDVAAYRAQGMSYREALAQTYLQTMPAGHSEHESGLALDILCSENVNMDTSQAQEPGNRWLAEHGHEYGFILRYPEDKEALTGISYEPWHFRYVGREAAAFLWEQQLSLEEFHDFLNE